MTYTGWGFRCGTRLPFSQGFCEPQEITSKENDRVKRNVQIAVFALSAALFSQTTFGQSTAGWKVRVDRSTEATDPDASGGVKFVASGSGFHATNPQAATYWNPANTATGTYTLKATFTLLRPSSHTNYYGLVFGGSDLGGPQQKYLYFTVAQDGTWLIKRRDGDATSTVSAKTSSTAVTIPDASGKSTNTLEVRVGADKIDYVVNATVVTTTPKTGATAKTDGVYGLRVNHVLDVQVDGLTVTK